MDVDSNPFRQFELWLEEALAAGGPDPRAMTLATVSPQGVPTARMVILRGHDERGFVFYTDLDSPKARDLAENPHAALVFHWAPLERQVRVSGTVSGVSPDQSAAYFRTRPRGAQLAAWIAQSRIVAGRAELEQRFSQLEAEYAGREVSCPPFWGGYRVVPESFEFWQGRPNRLHERARYTRSAAGGWLIAHLAP